MFVISKYYYFLVFLIIFQTAPKFASSASLSFSFPTFDPVHSNTTIICGGFATISADEGLQVTDNAGKRTWKNGRATYTQPLHLWDKAARTLTSFSTNFSFVIDSERRPSFGDGLAFIMVPVGSQPVNGSGAGLGYGLLKPNSNLPEPSQVVAVEFDTFSNSVEFDPAYVHVGINIGSLNSTKAVQWDPDIVGGAENNAWISYDARSMVLNVDFTDNQKMVRNLSHVVDLREHLPEFVWVGFSASTGVYFQKNIVKSWNFSSSVGKSIVIDDPESKGINPGMIIGVSIGVFVLVLAPTVYYLWRKKKNKMKKNAEWWGTSEEPIESDMDIEIEKGSGPKKFSYNERCRATSNFSEDHKLGLGGFGWVYRGTLRETNSLIAVKRLSEGSRQGKQEYVTLHKKLVKLLLQFFRFSWRQSVRSFRQWHQP